MKIKVTEDVWKTSDIKAMINESIQNWQRYQENINMVSEEELICYFSYMMKAEESRMSYLHKQLG